MVLEPALSPLLLLKVAGHMYDQHLRENWAATIACSATLPPLAFALGFALGVDVSKPLVFARRFFSSLSKRICRSMIWMS